MEKSPKFSPEVRERAVRMVQEHREEYASLWAAVASLAPNIDCEAEAIHDGLFARHDAGECVDAQASASGHSLGK